MTEQPQLTLDGTEVVIPAEPRRHSPYTAAQYAIMRLVAECDTITSSEAGRIVHACRVPPCERCQEGNCGFVAADGRDALMRLQARGLVRRIYAGRWGAAA
jgi:hypothetical protein